MKRYHVHTLGIFEVVEAENILQAIEIFLDTYKFIDLSNIIKAEQE